MSISILPPEILGEIFVCAQTYPIHIPFHNRDQHTILTQVCRQWQTTVSSTPSLWTRLYIRFTNHHQLVNLIEIAEQCLLRSGNLPVTLALYASARSPGSARVTLPSTPSNDVVQRFIRPNGYRWQKLDLVIAPESFDLLLSSPTDSFPNLKELTITTTSKNPEFTSCETPSTSLSQSPLTHLKLSTLGRKPINTWNLRCPWNQMIHINLSASRITAESCYTILRKCDRLETFLALISPTKQSPDVSRPIFLPHLHSLDIAPFTRTEDFSTFFTPLVTPNLKHFCFDCFQLDIPLHTIGFRAFQTRSNFQLEHLDLNIGVNDRAAFHDILNLSPSLLKLQISDGRLFRHNKDVVKGAIIPKLEHLVLTSGYPHSEELVAIIDARTKPEYPFPLKRLEAPDYITVEGGAIWSVYCERVRGWLMEYLA